MTRSENTQLTLFDANRHQVVSAGEAADVREREREELMAIPAEAIEEMTPREKFDWFHANNPHVYRALVLWTRREKYEFHEPCGSMKYAFEQLRKTGIELFGEEVEGKETRRARLNNNYTPYYAREVMKNEADLKGFFRTRGETDE